MVNVQIEGLRVFGKHGVFEEERKKLQEFIIDVSLEVEQVQNRDEISGTVDYVAVMKEIEEVNQSNSFQLIEIFANSLAERLLEKFAKVYSANVRVRKMPDIAGVNFDWVAAEVTITRDMLSG